MVYIKRIHSFHQYRFMFGTGWTEHNMAINNMLLIKSIDSIPTSGWTRKPRKHNQFRLLKISLLVPVLGECHIVCPDHVVAQRIETRVPSRAARHSALVDLPVTRQGPLHLSDIDLGMVRPNVPHQVAPVVVGFAAARADALFLLRICHGVIEDGIGFLLPGRRGETVRPVTQVQVADPWHLSGGEGSGECSKNSVNSFFAVLVRRSYFTTGLVWTSTSTC